MVNLKGREPHVAGFANFCPFWVPTIKQIRAFVGFILQPDLKLPRIVPDQNNKYRKEMILLKLHHTVFTTLRSFRDKCLSFVPAGSTCVVLGLASAVSSNDPFT